MNTQNGNLFHFSRLKQSKESMIGTVWLSINSQGFDAGLPIRMPPEEWPSLRQAHYGKRMNGTASFCSFLRRFSPVAATTAAL